jgi:LPXTG-motif cell wall-anchored protein
MKLRVLSAVGVSAAAIAAVSGATPAVAAPDCGPVPAGATLTVLGGTTCELDFAAAGSYSWTAPAGVQGLQALVLGGGSGALFAPASSTGYAGNAGELVYADFSSAIDGAPTTIVVGAGGASGDFGTDPEGGEASSVTVSGVVGSADGGVGGPAGFSLNCDPEGSGLDAGNGAGAGGDNGPSGVCETSYAPGLTPSIDAVDSTSAPRPAVFADVTTEFGIGGRVLITADTLPADTDLDGLGIGGNVRYDSGIDNFEEANGRGGSGRVILRYSVVALAATGTDAAPALTIAAVTAGLGAVLLAISRRRKQA